MILLVTCHQDNEWRQNLLQQDYTFFVPAPARPAGEPVMTWESEDRCADVPSSPGNPPHDDAEDVGEADDSAEDIGAPTCGITETRERRRLTRTGTRASG